MYLVNFDQNCIGDIMTGVLDGISQFVIFHILVGFVIHEVPCVSKWDIFSVVEYIPSGMVLFL